MSIERITTTIEWLLKLGGGGKCPALFQERLQAQIIVPKFYTNSKSQSMGKHRSMYA